MRKRELSIETVTHDYYGSARTARNESGCLIWLGRLDRDGYADRIKIGGKEYRPHRIMYELSHGVAPDVVDHVCHTASNCTLGRDCPHRACIEPEHLESVTAAENIRRGNTGIHKRSKTHCIDGHELSGHNLIIRKNGSRRCRTCANRRVREYLARKK